MTLVGLAHLRWILSACMLVAIVPAHSAKAANLPSPDRTVTLSVVDQDLAEVLTELGSQAGFRVSVSAAVHGRIHGRLPPSTPAVLLDRLSAMFGFQWYYDGETVSVSAYSEAGSKLLTLGGVDSDLLWRTMTQLGIADTRWPIHTTENGLALAVGPPRYLSLIDQTLAALLQKAPTAGEVHVFRGTAASQSL